jgi:hypothetical protein
MHVSECPDSEVWQGFLAGTVADRTSFETHLVECRTCRELVIELHDQAEEWISPYSESVPDSTKDIVKSFPLDAKSGGSRLRFYVPLGAAAAIILAVTLTVFVRPDTSRPPQVTDLRQAGGVSSEIVLDSPANRAELVQGSIEFRWSVTTPGAKYEFTLTDEKGDILSQQKLQTNTLTIDTIALKLSPGRRYYWSTKALMPTGATQESGIASFTLR